MARFVLPIEFAFSKQVSQNKTNFTSKLDFVLGKTNSNHDLPLVETRCLELGTKICNC